MHTLTTTKLPYEFTMEIRANDTNELMPLVTQLLREHGIESQSRNGPVLKFNEPVSIFLSRPWQRVNFSPSRNANPFFHVIESMAMLAPLNSVALMSYFAQNMRSFSDDGERYNAFYGERVLDTWGNQFTQVIDILRHDPGSRQAVVTIWHPRDLSRETRDKACNLQLLFSVDENGRLAMTSTNRSNDAIWGGVSGANIVHLSFFHEYIALSLDRAMGPWCHFANNLHVYTDRPEWKRIQEAENLPTICSMYDGDWAYISLFHKSDQQEVFDREVKLFAKMALAALQTHDTLSRGMFTTDFLKHVAVPMFNAWHSRKLRNYEDMWGWTTAIGAEDWRQASVNWLERKEPQ